MTNPFAIVRAGTAAAVLGILGAASDAATLLVPSQYATIQAAVDEAVNGDLVLVSAGTYSEHLLIQDKSIEVRGATGAKTTGVDGGSRRIGREHHRSDAGSNRHARGLHGDFEGNPRIVDGGNGRRVDIGAYEYQPD